MNYRHAYHAGNFADVHKHAALTLLLGHLQRKETPFQVIDSHAGVGVYDLSGLEAGRTCEYQDGIARLMQEPAPDPLLATYLDAVRRENDGGLRFYPGSPQLIRGFLRADDRLTLVELQDEDAATLRRRYHRDRQVTVRQEDAYQALKALLPPLARRGLVLIDPPYEKVDEALRLIAGLAEALRRWPTGIYAIWYPIKALAEAERFTAELVRFARPCLTSELLPGTYTAGAAGRLAGSGLALINPPWQLDQQLAALLRLLAAGLSWPGQTRLRWLVNE